MARCCSFFRRFNVFFRRSVYRTQVKDFRFRHLVASVEGRGCYVLKERVRQVISVGVYGCSVYDALFGGAYASGEGSIAIRRLSFRARQLRSQLGEDRLHVRKDGISGYRYQYRRN